MRFVGRKQSKDHKKIESHRERQLKPKTKVRIFLSHISKSSLLCGLLFSLAITTFVVHDIGYSSNVSLQYVLQDSQNRNYRFYTDDLSGSYPFGKSNWFDKTVIGSKQIQTVAVSVPRNSIDKLRVDPAYLKSGQNQLYIYKIVISDFFTKTEIPSSEIMRAFHSYKSLKLTSENNAVKVTFDQPNQSVEAAEGWQGIKTLRFSGIAVILLLLLVSSVAFYALFYYLSYLRKINSQGNLTFRRSLPYLVGSVIVIPLCIMLCSFILQYGTLFDAFSFVGSNFWGFMEAYLFVLLLFLLFLVFGRAWIAAICAGLPVIALTIINYYKFQFRGSPVFPWDFSLTSDVESVFGGMNLKFTFPVAELLALFVLMVIVLYFFPPIPYRAMKKRNQIFAKIGEPAVCLVLLTVYVFNVFWGPGVQYNEWDNTTYYKENGVVTAFMNNMHLLQVAKPSDYSQAKMQQIVDQVLQLHEEEASKTASAVKKPNIIMIMSESFWDITQLKGVTFSQEEFPTIDWLRKNAVAGSAFTSIYGGGTSNTEFEALTGFSKQFMRVESTPYQDTVTHPFFSLASYLKSEGYTTEAMHPYLATNWNRNVAYPFMGFESFLSQPNFTYKDSMRSFISDMSVTNQIIEEYEKHKKQSDTPLMNLTVTVQNHPNYSSDRWNQNENEVVKFNAPFFSQSVADGFKDLATGLHKSDLALGKLIDYFKNQKDPTIIIFYGDHMSPTGDSPYGIFTQAGNFSESADDIDVQYNTHQVPLVMWSNYINVKKDIGLIGSSQISATMMQLYGLEEPPIFSFLNALKKVSPGYSVGVILNPDDTYSGILTAEEQKWYDEYRLLQYDYIYGKQYAAVLWK